jgi:hypothetical protein
MSIFTEGEAPGFATLGEAYNAMGSRAPHNERGLRHPGYGAFLCPICAQVTIKAVTAVHAQTCGRWECVVLAGEPLVRGG